MSRAASRLSAARRQLAAARRAMADALEAPDAESADVTSSLYSQRDGERPIGCGPTKYLRVWRRARGASDPEATSNGRARLLTPAAFARHSASTETKARAPKPTTPITPTLADDVLRELGATRTRRSV